MSENVTNLRDANEDPASGVVDALEAALAEARAGRLRSVMIVGEMTGNAVYSRIEVADRLTALGALHHTMYRLHRTGDG